jgi:peptidyl-prolyl cis-trans isomerase A (cyclophilin A)
MKNMKKPLLMVLFCTVISFFGGCSPMDKSMKAIEGKDGVFAVMETSKGNIVLELYYKDTPLTVTNFVGLAEGTLDAAKGRHFYDGLKFHRVISKANGDAQDFMIQGGDPKGNGTGGPGYQFPNEICDKYSFDRAGVLAMANAGPNTNGSQFFITVTHCTWLNGDYSIFGKVVDGQDVVNTTKQGDLIKKVTIVRQGDEAKKFTATQADFDNLVLTAAKKVADAKEAQFADQIKTIEQKFPGYQKDSNGIYYKTTKEGSGNKTGKGRHVAVDYKGYLLDGKVFDTSKQPGREPLEFQTDGGQMISGFDIMVQDMKLGESRTIVLPPDLAYGSRGAGGVIPGNTYIVFDVDLKKN